MEKKIIIIMSSARKNSNTNFLAETAANEAIKLGAVVRKFYLPDLNIRHCDACEFCKSNNKKYCKHNDDMNLIYPHLLSCDGIILASPIYWFSVSGRMKVFLDRTYALGKHDNWDALRGKKALLIMAYADPDPLESGVTNAFRMFQDAFAFLGVEIMGCIHSSCSSAGSIKKNLLIVKKTKELTKRLIT